MIENHDVLVDLLQQVNVDLGEGIPDDKDNTNEYKKARDSVRTAISFMNHRKESEVSA